nr:hypothetical protein [Ensifer sp. IC4062]
MLRQSRCGEHPQTPLIPAIASLAKVSASAADRNGEPGVDAAGFCQDGGGVDPDAEESQMPEVEDAAVTKPEIPVRRDDRVDEGDDE